MEIDNRPDTVTITLTRKEANQLRETLQTADYDPNGFSLYELSEGIRDCRVPRREAADAITKVARKRTERAFESPGDIAEMLFVDAKDLLAIADAVREGDDGAARRWVLNLDTAVREDIPECAYPYVGLRKLR